MQQQQPITISSGGVSLLSGIGMILIGAAFLLYAFTYYLHPQNQGGVVYPEYQLVKFGSGEDGNLLLHANGGHVWKQTCFGGEYKGGKCTGLVIWQEMYVENLTPQDSPVAKAYNDLAAKAE